MVKRAHMSPSMAVALLALLVALTGTSYAAVKINGKDISKGSIPGNRLKDEGVSGRQVDEAALGSVPRAHDADTLGGLSPGSFLAKGGKAADAELLDGLDASGFVKGAGDVDGQSIDTGPNTTVFLGPAIGGLVRFRYQCPASLGSNGTLRIINASTGTTNLFIDSGGVNPDSLQLGAGGFIEYPTAAAGDSFFVQMQGSPGVLLASVATVHRVATSDCHAQAFGALGQ